MFFLFAFLCAFGKMQLFREFQPHSTAQIFIFRSNCESCMPYDCEHYFHYSNNSGWPALEVWLQAAQSTTMLVFLLKYKACAVKLWLFKSQLSQTYIYWVFTMCCHLRAQFIERSGLALASLWVSQTCLSVPGPADKPVNLASEGQHRGRGRKKRVVEGFHNVLPS